MANERRFSFSPPRPRVWMSAGITAVTGAFNRIRSRFTNNQAGDLSGEETNNENGDGCAEVRQTRSTPDGEETIENDNGRPRDQQASELPSEGRNKESHETKNTGNVEHRTVRQQASRLQDEKDDEAPNQNVGGSAQYPQASAWSPDDGTHKEDVEEREEVAGHQDQETKLPPCMEWHLKSAKTSGSPNEEAQKENNGQRNKEGKLLGHLAIELVFPQCAIWQAWDKMLQTNQDTMQALIQLVTNVKVRKGSQKETCHPFPQSFACNEGALESVGLSAHLEKEVTSMSRQIYIDIQSRIFVAGSFAEGLAMQPTWGHEQTEEDMMSIFPGAWCVHVPEEEGQGQDPSLEWKGPVQYAEEGPDHLLLCTEGCPLAYCRVKVVGSPEVLADIMGKGKLRLKRGEYEEVGTDGARNCFVTDPTGHDQLWLSSQKTFRLLTWRDIRKERRVSGPVAQVTGGKGDLVVALFCSRPLSHMHRYRQRLQPARWPQHDTVELMCKIPGLIVCVGHKLSPYELQKTQFRISFGIQETLLANDMPLWVKQGYIAFKYTVKAELKKVRQLLPAEGKSNISSYHMKTVLLWMLEQNSNSWDVECPFHLFLMLLKSFKSHIEAKEPNIPNYFIPECNLLENTDPVDIRNALQVLQQIEADAVCYIIGSPQSPGLVSGCGVVSDDEEIAEWWKSTLQQLNQKNVGLNCDILASACMDILSSDPEQTPHHFLRIYGVACFVDAFRQWHLDLQRRMDIQPDDPRFLVSHRPDCLNLQDLIAPIFPTDFMTDLMEDIKNFGQSDSKNQ